ncbi:MAG TPA: CsbD family protein [Verrucomicrobiae bacterium]|nr:CsbD family protein [Verrucomicrobiae bacterium]
MSTLAAIGNWNIAKGKLKQTLSQLTADDEQFAAGKQDELTGRIQKRTAEARKKNGQPAEGCCGCDQ